MSDVFGMAAFYALLLSAAGVSLWYAVKRHDSRTAIAAAISIFLGFIVGMLFGSVFH